MDQTKIGHFLKQLRVSNKLTQEELGEKIGVNNKTISRWETGMYMPSIETLQILSKFYKVSINELICGEYLTQENIIEKTDNNICYISNNNQKQIKKIITISIISIFSIILCFLTIFAINFIVSRNKKLFSKLYSSQDINKTYQNAINIENITNGNTIYESESGSNSIKISLPTDYYVSQLNNVYKNDEGSFILLRTFNINEITNPTTTALSQYFYDSKRYKYSEQVIYAYQYPISTVSIFSSEYDLDIASGCKMIRTFNFVPNNNQNDVGSFYAINGKLFGYIMSASPSGTLENVWSGCIEWNNCLLFFTIKDPLIGANLESITNWISSINLLN